VDAENGTVAVRGADGRLSILDARKNRFTAEMWLAADGDGRKAGDDLGSGFRCDSRGCTARLPDGTIVAVARQREAFADDCREAGLVVTRHEVPESCRAAVIDRRTLATTGAIALRRVDGKWVAEPARSPLATRPWFGRARAADPQALLRLEGRSAGAPGADASIDDDGDEAGPEQHDAVDD
jgi:competence protein ComEC